MAQLIDLDAGRIRLQYHDGRLRYLRVDGVEVLRHIYMAVRDAHWNTIPARILNETIERSADGFQICFEAEHRENGIHFHWSGTFTGSPQGVTASLDGSAMSSFLRNRIGWCVLHPTSGCAGRPCTVEHTDGSIQHLVFPEQIDPHQPFLDVRAITHEAAPGVSVRVSFEGDVFETEDQRNWTDDSFKTYSTPLSRPFPVQVNPGDRVRQTVIVTTADRTILRLEDSHVPFPSIGLLDAADTRFQHVRVDARHPLPDTECPLEVAVHVRDPRDLTEARQRVSDRKIARWLIYDADKPATTVETLTAAREVLGSNARIGGGTDHNFAELNRNRACAGTADFIAFSANPQAHLDDEFTIMENLPAIAAAVRSAKAFSNGKPVVLSPITWKRRFNHHKPDLAEPPDPREDQPIAAAWLVGVLKYAAEAGADSVTLSPSAGRLVLERIAAFQPDRVQAVSSTDPLKAVALAMWRGTERQVLVANLTSTSRSVQLEEQTLTLAPWEIVQL